MLGTRLQCVFQTTKYDEIWFVSFSLKMAGLVRMLQDIKNAIKGGTKIHFVIGIDHNSTSYEALEELLKLGIDTKIVKDASLGRTFHPKLYLFEANGRKAELFIGSSNMTGGGLYTNYESNIHLTFDLSGKDDVEYARHKKELDSFINPSGKIVQILTNSLLQLLAKRKDVQSEVIMSQTFRRVATHRKKMQASPFGSTVLPDLPPIPSEYKQKMKKESERKSEKVLAVTSVNALYLELNRGKTQTPTVPNEVRIPLAALKLDGRFWGWNDMYVMKRYKKRGKISRKYMERYAKWQVIDANNPTNTYLDNRVRMYVYKERGEFRIYSANLVELRPDEFDIIKITRSTDSKSDYICEFARKGSSRYNEWLPHCTIPIAGNSQRKFGFT